VPTTWFFKRIAFTAHGTVGGIIGRCVDRNEGKVGKIGRVNKFIGIAVDERGGAHNCSTAL
jgi:hypothetical protein